MTDLNNSDLEQVHQKEHNKDTGSDIEALKKRVAELEKLWTIFEGAGLLAKWIFWGLGPVAAAILYVKDHWKP